MSTLHIVQGGVKNGDKAWIEKAARLKLSSSESWVAPMSANIGDEVVVFVAGCGFFATARIKSQPKKRSDWANRYGASLTSIRLIKPAISIAAIRRGIPALKWANYPRSITTPTPEVAEQVRTLIARRRKTGLPDLDVESIETASIDELRAVALFNSRSVAESKKRTANYRVRSLAIRLYVLCRANGHCEGCEFPAPFSKSDGSAYLEPHHTMQLADDGPDHPARVIALCPNCHRHAHHGDDAERFNALLKKRLLALEPR